MAVPNVKKRKGCSTKTNKKIIQQNWVGNVARINQDNEKFKVNVVYGVHSTDILPVNQVWCFQRHFLKSQFARIARYVKSATATYFFASDSYSFRVITQDIRLFDDKDGQKRLAYSKPFSVELRVTSDGVPSILRQEKLVTIPSSIKQCYKLLKIFQNLFHADSDFLTIFNQNFFTDTSDYYVARNKLLNQLPIDPKQLKNLYRQGRMEQCVEDEYENHIDYSDYHLDMLLNGYEYSMLLRIELLENERLNRRRRMLYHLKNGNTHKAIEAYLESNTYPKAIRREILKFDFIPKPFLDDLSAKLVTMDNNRVLTVLQALSDNPSIASFNVALEILDNSNHFHYKHLITHKQVFSDTLKMIAQMRSRCDGAQLQRIEDSLVTFRVETKDIREYHNKVITLFNNTKHEYYPQWNEPYQSPTFETFCLANQPTMIRPLHCINEMIDIGIEMGICVAVYRHEQSYGQLEILVLTEDDKYIACLEVDHSGGRLVQAKLKYNKPVSSSPKYADIVKKWAATNNVRIYTNDM